MGRMKRYSLCGIAECSARKASASSASDGARRTPTSAPSPSSATTSGIDVHSVRRK